MRIIMLVLALLLAACGTEKIEERTILECDDSGSAGSSGEAGSAGASGSAGSAGSSPDAGDDAVSCSYADEQPCGDTVCHFGYCCDHQAGPDFLEVGSGYWCNGWTD